MADLLVERARGALSPSVPARRRRVQAAAAAALLPLLAALALGCTTVVVPPPDPAAPLPVFLLDHGRHSTLVLPDGRGGLVRYAYGDWDWYARAETGVLEGSRAVLWPSQAALGRRALAGPPTADAVRQAVLVGIEALYEIAVEEGRVARLRAELEALFARGRDTWLYNAAYDLEFVHHPRAYTAIRNSNRVVAGWLAALGCEVRGAALFASWRVERPRRLGAAPSRPARAPGRRSGRRGSAGSAGTPARAATR